MLVNRRLFTSAATGLGMVSLLVLYSLLVHWPTPETVQAGTGVLQSSTPLPLVDANTGIIVSGQGQVRMQPNIARATIGVQVTAPTLVEAANQANTKMTAVIDRLKSLGVADRDIQTVSYNVNPITNPPREGGTPAPTVTGYRVSNLVSVTVRKLDDLGKLLDGAINAGANNIHGIWLDVDNSKPFQERARAAAVKDAQDKATQLAKAANIQLGRVLSIDEGTTFPRPPVPVAAPEITRGGGVPIEIGELTLTVNVNMRFAIQ